MHEYGHFIASSFSHDNSPGGTHSLSESDQDVRLAWSEGWATFFGSAVLGSPLAVDTRAGGVSSFNIESATNSFTTNEVSVSAILWDIFDAPFPDDDPITKIAFPTVWKSFANIPTATTTMEQFSFLFMADQPDSVTPFRAILIGRSITFSPDVGESGEATLIANGSSQNHTLYQSGSNPVGDEDVIPLVVISGTTYTIRTSNLTNGADTFLTISGLGLTNDNADGKTYVANCEPSCPKNNTTNLTSSITFVANATGISASVKRSPSAPNSTGLTGSYDIELTTSP
jgi:hypothetical protein